MSLQVDRDTWSSSPVLDRYEDGEMFPDIPFWIGNESQACETLWYGSIWFDLTTQSVRLLLVSWNL